MAGMKAKMLVLTLAVWFAVGALCLAASSQVGTWKLNEPKSKFTPGTGKNTTVVYKDGMGGKVKITTDGIDAHSKPAHSEWTGKFDGKIMPLPAIRIQTCAPTRRSMIAHWISS